MLQSLISEPLRYDLTDIFPHATERAQSYHSPFDTLAVRFQDYKEGISQMRYVSTLDDLLTKVEERARFPAITASDAAALILHPPRIIRAALDYKVDTPSDLGAEELLKDAIQLALKLYSEPTFASKDIDSFRRKVVESGHADLLTRVLKQQNDGVTWAASNPKISEFTAHALADGKEDLLFVALGHGGVAAGMDVYLRYCDITGSENSKFYVARFSTQKLGDPLPRLSPTEIAYLRDLAKGRRVVVFDEDSCSGSTLKRAESYFTNMFSSGQRVTVMANLNARGKLIQWDVKLFNPVKGKELNPGDEYTHIKNVYGQYFGNKLNAPNIPSSYIPSSNIPHFSEKITNELHSPQLGKYISKYSFGQEIKPKPKLLYLSH